MPRDWEQRSTTRILSNRIFAIDRHQRVSPRTGQALDFFVIEASDWCNIVPVTPDGEVVMVRQHRHGTREVTLEVPGGMVDATDASPLEAARRELLEETGYAADTIDFVGVVAPNPAILSNRCHSFVARGARKVAEPALDGGEDIEVVTVPLVEIPGRIAAGEITHSLVIVAFAWALGLRAP